MTTTSAVSEKVRVRLADVAREAKLSISTVSMALADHPNINGGTKQRVRKISQRLGYARAAPAQRRAATVARLCALKHFGFMVLGARPDDMTYSGPLYPLTTLVRQAGGRMQVEVVQSVDPQAELQAIQSFARRLSGLFLVGQIQHQLVEMLRGIPVPCVILNAVIAAPTQLPAPHVFVVVPDHVRMGRTSTALLAQRGHRRIAFLSEALTPGLMFSQNLMGYRLAHLELGLKMDEALIHISGQSGAPGSGGESAAAAFDQLDDPPTAFYVPNPRLAASFLRAREKRHRPVPRHAMFIVSDPDSAQGLNLADRPLVYCESDRLAAAGFDLLIRLLQGPAPAGLTVLAPPTFANLPTS